MMWYGPQERRHGNVSKHIYIYIFLIFNTAKGYVLLSLCVILLLCIAITNRNVCYLHTGVPKRKDL